jgi:hypothetical protein
MQAFECMHYHTHGRVVMQDGIITGKYWRVLRDKLMCDDKLLCAAVA